MCARSMNPNDSQCHFFRSNAFHTTNGEIFYLITVFCYSKVEKIQIAPEFMENLAIDFRPLKVVRFSVVINPVN